MFDDETVALGQAAKIAGVSTSEMIDLLGARTRRLLELALRAILRLHAVTILGGSGFWLGG